MAATYILRTERDRNFALAAVVKARVGEKPDQVRISRPTRNLDQNRHLHGLLGEIAEQLAWPAHTGELHSVEWWKRATTLQWLIESKSQPDLIASLDGLQMGLLLPHTSDLTIEQCAAYIEFLYAFGTTNGVVFTEPEPPPREDDGR